MPWKGKERERKGLPTTKTIPRDRNIHKTPRRTAKYRTGQKQCGRGEIPRKNIRCKGPVIPCKTATVQLHQTAADRKTPRKMNYNGMSMEPYKAKRERQGPQKTSNSERPQKTRNVMTRCESPRKGQICSAITKGHGKDAEDHAGFGTPQNTSNNAGLLNRKGRGGRRNL